MSADSDVREKVNNAIQELRTVSSPDERVEKLIGKAFRILVEVRDRTDQRIAGNCVLDDN